MSQLYCGFGISFPVSQVVEGVVDDEARITVIETTTGEKLSGDSAPKKAELEEWLKQNPGYEVFGDGAESDVGGVSNHDNNIV